MTHELCNETVLYEPPVKGVKLTVHNHSEHYFLNLDLVHEDVNITYMIKGISEELFLKMSEELT